MSDESPVLVCTPCTKPYNTGIPLAGTIACDTCGVDCWISASSKEAFRRHDDLRVRCEVCALDQLGEQIVLDLLPEQEEELRALGHDIDFIRALLRLFNDGKPLKPQEEL